MNAYIHILTHHDLPNAGSLYFICDHQSLLPFLLQYSANTHHSEFCVCLLFMPLLLLFFYFVCACRESVRYVKDALLLYEQKSQPTNIFVICIISECFLKHDNSVVRSESWYLVILPKKCETSSHGLVALGFWHIRCIYTVVYVVYILVEYTYTAVPYQVQANLLQKAFCGGGLSERGRF